MKTINTNIEHEIIIKNSRFIAIIIRLDNDNITNILNELKIKYPKATHYCYAYKYENYQKSSDDGEPTGTAGNPILNVLEKEKLTNILVVVIRYFGGIKLGAGGLIRAYTKAVTEALKESNYIELIEGYQVSLEFDYSQEKTINHLLLNSEIIKKDYNEKTSYLVNIPKEDINNLSTYNYTIIKNVYIEKKR